MSQTAAGFYHAPIVGANAARLWTRWTRFSLLDKGRRILEELLWEPSFRRVRLFQKRRSFFFNIVPFLPTRLCDGLGVSGVSIGSPEKPRSNRSCRPLRKKTAVKTTIVPLSWRYGPEKCRKWWQTKPFPLTRLDAAISDFQRRATTNMSRRTNNGFGRDEGLINTRADGVTGI